MKYWFGIAMILASLARPAIQAAICTVHWAGAQRPPYLTPDHKPTAKLPLTKLA
jgi:hypothetical protein